MNQILESVSANQAGTEFFAKTLVGLAGGETAVRIHAFASQVAFVITSLVIALVCLANQACYVNQTAQTAGMEGTVSLNVSVLTHNYVLKTRALVSAFLDGKITFALNVVMLTRMDRTAKESVTARMVNASPSLECARVMMDLWEMTAANHATVQHGDQIVRTPAFVTTMRSAIPLKERVNVLLAGLETLAKTPALMDTMVVVVNQCASV